MKSDSLTYRFLPCPVLCFCPPLRSCRYFMVAAKNAACRIHRFRSFVSHERFLSPDGEQAQAWKHLILLLKNQYYGIILSINRQKNKIHSVRLRPPGFHSPRGSRISCISSPWTVSPDSFFTEIRIHRNLKRVVRICVLYSLRDIFVYLMPVRSVEADDNIKADRLL